MAFIPEGSQVFNLNMKHNLTDLYSPTTHPSVTQKAVDIMTEKILSLCQTLNLYPKIRYQSKLAFAVPNYMERYSGIMIYGIARETLLIHFFFK